jgi:hypothetical protein
MENRGLGIGDLGTENGLSIGDPICFGWRTGCWKDEEWEMAGVEEVELSN